MEFYSVALASLELAIYIAQEDLKLGDLSASASPKKDFVMLCPGLRLDLAMYLCLISNS